MNTAHSTADLDQRAAATPQRFIRTLLGDLPADTLLGVCDAHEHVALDGQWLAAHFPEFVHANVDRTLVDLRAFRAASGGWIVDSMPGGAGRDAALLAKISQLSRVPIVCPTGVHQPKYYPPDDPLLALDREELAAYFVREITTGIDDGDGQLAFHAGVIKVASTAERLTPGVEDRFAAAALAQRGTGCPILAHTEGGRDAFAQAACLIAHGADLSRVVLSHCDKNGDMSYHRDLLRTGACLEYDQHFRQLSRGESCVAVKMIVELIEEFPRQLLVGMDMARQTYWRGYGGRPGLAWLVTDLLPRLRREGLTEQQLARVAVENAVDAFAFRLPNDFTEESRTP